MTGTPETNPSAPGSLRLKIGGMTCQNCVRHVREALQATAGVRSVEVDLARGEALVAAEEGSGLAAGALIDKVRSAGFEAAEFKPADPSPAGHTWNTSLVLFAPATI